MVGGCVLLKFNEEAAPVAAAGLAVVSLRERINRVPGMQPLPTDLVSVFFSMSIKK